MPLEQAVADDGTGSRLVLLGASTGRSRDTEAIANRKFPVFATGVALRGPSKSAGGSVGQLAEIGGTIVHTGDWLVADADGVVLVDARHVDFFSPRPRHEHCASDS